VSDVTADSVLRVVCWNVRRGREPGFAEGVERIAALSPDVVLLQEVEHPPAGAGPGVVGTDQLAAGRVGGTAHFFPTLTGRPDGDYGLAIVTRLPVSTTGSAPISVPDRLEPRLACWVVTPSLVIATTHLSNRPKRLPRKQFRPTLDGLPLDVELVAGDLNFRPWRQRYGRWHRVPNNGRRTAATFPTAAPRSAIDHVLTTTPHRIVSTRVLPISGSDHRPILVEWRPRRSTAP
jgi:endonuclease/exonuclease/phosphatase family metal-dependent hydrolase